ncbi:MAG TPA: aldose 1-epimerase [Chitinophagaceae bacterium]|nr:aldose 1-epimerase [Chitinophagaceae bacterium]
MTFKVEEIKENGLDMIRMSQFSHGHSVDLVPSQGAMWHAWRIPRGGGIVNLLDSYKSLEDCRSGLRESFRGVKLSPFACRLKDGEYLFEGNSFRIAKRLNTGEAHHGLLYDQPFDVQSIRVDAQKASVKLLARYAGDDAGYPFPYTCSINFDLYAGNCLVVQTEIINQSAHCMPLMDGWHPYFRTGSPIDALEFRLSARVILEMDDRLIPTGSQLAYKESGHYRKIGAMHLDTAFLLDFSQPQPLFELRDPIKGISIFLEPEPSYPLLQMFTPISRESIALEPLSGAPDAFHNKIGLEVLGPGQKKQFRFRVYAHSL